MMRPLLSAMWLVIAMSVTGCANSASEFMREPFFSPVGAGLAPEETAGIQSAEILPQAPPCELGTATLLVQRTTHCPRRRYRESNDFDQ